MEKQYIIRSDGTKDFVINISFVITMKSIYVMSVFVWERGIYVNGEGMLKTYKNTMQ